MSPTLIKVFRTNLNFCRPKDFSVHSSPTLFISISLVLTETSYHIRFSLCVTWRKRVKRYLRVVGYSRFLSLFPYFCSLWVEKVSSFLTSLCNTIIKIDTRQLDFYLSVNWTNLLGGRRELTRVHHHHQEGYVNQTLVQKCSRQ